MQPTTTFQPNSSFFQPRPHALQPPSFMPQHSAPSSASSSASSYTTGNVIVNSPSVDGTATLSATIDSLRIHYRVFILCFKAGRKDIYILPRADPAFIVSPDDFVIVEADRGHDLGQVVKEIGSNDVAEIVQFRNPNQPLNPRLIVRLAMIQEISTLASKSREEMQAVAVTNMVARGYGLPITIIDAEYQWDRMKLTLFFEAENRVDFRELVRGLFKVYRVRIMMRRIKEGSRPVVQPLVDPPMLDAIDTLPVDLAPRFFDSSALPSSNASPTNSEQSPDGQPAGRDDDASNVLSFSPWATSTTWSPFPSEMAELTKKSLAIGSF